MRRVGLVGLGHVAPHHINGIDATPDLTLTATADLQPRPPGLEDLECPHFLSLGEMLAQMQPDIVVIATPPASHLPLVQEALRFGADILLEKPATPTPEEFATLQELADGSPHRVDVALHAAFGREMIWFQAHAAELVARFGPPTGFLCQFRDPYVVKSAITPEAAGLGGSWRDSGINALSVLARILPRTEMTVKTAEFTFPEDTHPLDVCATVGLSWAGGSGRIETDWRRAQNMKRTEVTFADGTAKLLLHHSGEFAEIQSASGTERIALANTQERLTNHYTALFEAYAGTETRETGFGLVPELHQLLFDALDRNTIGKVC